MPPSSLCCAVLKGHKAKESISCVQLAESFDFYLSARVGMGEDGGVAALCGLGALALVVLQAPKKEVPLI